MSQEQLEVAIPPTTRYWLGVWRGEGISAINALRFGLI